MLYANLRVKGVNVKSIEELLGIFWDESYPGGSDSPIALEPKEVYTDHAHGIAAVRRAVIEDLAEEAGSPDDIGWILDGGDSVADWLRSHLDGEEA